MGVSDTDTIENMKYVDSRPVSDVTVLPMNAKAIMKDGWKLPHLSTECPASELTDDNIHALDKENIVSLPPQKGGR